MLDSLVVTPFGNAIHIKDSYGYNVDVSHANIFDHPGLMFTSGTKCMTLTLDEWNSLKGYFKNNQSSH